MYLLVVLCLCILPLSSGQDTTLVDGAGGKDVVEAVVDRIRSNCILADDKSFLRRLAAVQSQNGLSYSLGTGGIWQVSSTQLGKVQLACGTSLTSVCTTVQTKFLVNMSSSSMSDLDKPFYSGLAMALLILSTGQAVPAHQSQQGVFWKNNISPSGDIKRFTQYSNHYSTFSCPAAQMDLVFVIDASGSVGSNNFLETLTFLRAVVTNMEIGQDKVRIAVVRYSSSSTISFGLSQYSIQSDVLSAITSISYTGGGTNTATALETARTSVFNINQRPTASKVLVLVTDGHSNDQQLTLQAAAKLKADNIIVFTIGIGNVNTVEMHGVASSPSCTHYYQLSAYSEIDAIIREIQSDSCSAPVVLTQNTTLVDNTLPNNNDTKVQVIGIPTKSNTTTNASDTTVVRVDVVCGNLRIYASYDTTKPNSAFYTYSTNATDNVPGWIRAVAKTMNKTLYISVYADRRFDLINSQCTKPHYNISIDPPNIGARPTTVIPTTARLTTARPTTARLTTAILTTVKPTTARLTTVKPTTAILTTAILTTVKPTTARPTTAGLTTAILTTVKPTTARLTTVKPTTAILTTAILTTVNPTTARPTTARPTTARLTTAIPTTVKPTTARPTTARPTTAILTTVKPTTARLTTAILTTVKPTTARPTTARPTTARPTTARLTTAIPTTARLTTAILTTVKPTTARLTTAILTTVKPTTARLTTAILTTVKPTTAILTTAILTTARPTTARPTTTILTTVKPTTARLTTAILTTIKPTTARLTTAILTTVKPTTSRPTTARPTTARLTTAILTTVKPTTARTTTAAALINPCTQKAILSHEVYHTHSNPAKFIQCDAWGNFDVMFCRPGTVWSQAIKTCIWASGTFG